MQIQILKPHRDGKCYPDYSLMIANAYDEDERNYLLEVKRRHEEWEQMGYKDFDGFAFGLIYTNRQACGHYEIFQHPIYRMHGKEPTESDIRKSIESVLEIIEASKNRKCTSCTCGWR